MTRHSESGFTVIETMIAVSVSAIIGLGFLGFVSNYMVTITNNNKLVEMTVNSQKLLRSTVENIRYGDGVRQTNSITDPNGPGGGWNTNNTNFVIILAVPAVTKAGDFIIDETTGSPFMNELVYYKSNTNLLRRTLTNPAATGNSLVRSCPPANSTPTCPADNLLAPDVSSMVFTLYDQDGGQTTTVSQARSIKIDLTMKRGSTANPLTIDNSIRVTLRNRF